MKQKQQIIVTGGAGFIGSHITYRLLREGYKVTVLDNLSNSEKGNIPKGADFIKLNLGEETAYKKYKGLKGSAVFHLAGQSSGELSFKDPLYDFKSHVFSTFWLLKWAKEQKIKRFIYASSMGVYGEPAYLPVDEAHPCRTKTFYGAAKLGAEAYIRLYQDLGLNTTILRLFNAYGPGQNLKNKFQGMVSIYLSYMLEGIPIIVRGSKDRFRDFIYIDDIVEAWMRVFHNPAAYGKTYNVASGQKTKVEGLLNMLRVCFGNPDYPIQYKGTTPGDQFGLVADITLISKDLGWKPKINLREGLRRMVDFERSKI